MRYSITPEQNRAEPQAWLDDPLFHVVLYHPEIPNNTGSIGRTCVGLNAKLWLVRPLGYQINDTQLKRAGLDYWPDLDWEAVNNWDHLLQRFQECGITSLVDESRFWFFSKKAVKLYSDVFYRKGDIFVYGPESVGLPSLFLETRHDNLLRIPISEKIRSLNVSVSVGITLFEAQRQIMTR